MARLKHWYRTSPSTVARRLRGTRRHLAIRRARRTHGSVAAYMDEVVRGAIAGEAGSPRPR